MKIWIVYVDNTQFIGTYRYKWVANLYCKLFYSGKNVSISPIDGESWHPIWKDGMLMQKRFVFGNCTLIRPCTDY